MGDELSVDVMDSGDGWVQLIKQSANVSSPTMILFAKLCLTVVSGLVYIHELMFELRLE